MTRPMDGLVGLESALAFHRDRHLILAGNVANLDTPGFVPKDLVRTPGAAAGGELERTHEGHLEAAAGGDGVEGQLDPSAPPRRDGNQVSLERELAKLDANRVRYFATTELISRRLALLRYSAGDGR